MTDMITQGKPRQDRETRIRGTEGDDAERKARQWSDSLQDDPEDAQEPYEPAYRDGTPKYECWDDR